MNSTYTMVGFNLTRAVFLGTGVLSSLAHLFPFGTGTPLLNGIAVFFFAVNLGLFIFVLSCTIARYYMFPEVSVITYLPF